jgi:hypothetical protein
MLKQLMARRYLCSDEHINAFYNHISRECNDNCGDCNYSWEIDSTGYFLHGKSSVTYFRFTDGMVFRFMSVYHLRDIEMLNELNEIASNSNEFRIERAITSDIVRFEGHDYLYYVSQRPNKEFGLTGVEEVLMRDKTVFFKEFVDQFATLIPYIEYIYKKYGLGPSVTNLHIQASRARDSIGHYWKDIRIFKVPPLQVIEESKKRLLMSTLLLGDNTTKDIMNYADQKWCLT